MSLKGSCLFKRAHTCKRNYRYETEIGPLTQPATCVHSLKEKQKIFRSLFIWRACRSSIVESQVILHTTDTLSPHIDGLTTLFVVMATSLHDFIFLSSTGCWIFCRHVWHLFDDSLACTVCFSLYGDVHDTRKLVLFASLVSTRHLLCITLERQCLRRKLPPAIPSCRGKSTIRRLGRYIHFRQEKEAVTERMAKWYTLAPKKSSNERRPEPKDLNGRGMHQEDQRRTRMCGRTLSTHSSSRQTPGQEYKKKHRACGWTRKRYCREQLRLLPSLPPTSLSSPSILASYIVRMLASYCSVTARLIAAPTFADVSAGKSAVAPVPTAKPTARQAGRSKLGLARRFAMATSS